MQNSSLMSGNIMAKYNPYSSLFVSGTQTTRQTKFFLFLFGIYLERMH